MTWGFLNGKTETNLITDLSDDFAVVFTSNRGKKVLEVLKKMTIYKSLSPSSSDNELRHLEGQRDLVRLIECIVNRSIRKEKND